MSVQGRREPDSHRQGIGRRIETKQKQSEMREIKFQRVFKNTTTGKITMQAWGNINHKGESVFEFESFVSPGQSSHSIPIADRQYTGLKDKNVNNTCIYEGDIVSLLGILIGNKYENEDLLKDPTNLLIEGFGAATWRVTEKEAMDRGCHYSE